MRVGLGNRRLGLRLRQQEEKKEKKTKLEPKSKRKFREETNHPPDGRRICTIAASLGLVA